MVEAGLGFAKSTFGNKLGLAHDDPPLHAQLMRHGGQKTGLDCRRNDLAGFVGMTENKRSKFPLDFEF